MFNRSLLTFVLAWICVFLSAQDFSNKGKDFWIAYPSHIDGTASVMGIYITSDVNATGTIQVGPTATVPFTVTANQVTRKFLGSSGAVDASNTYVLVTQQDGVKTNAAIHIISDKPVVVYTHIIRSARSGATLALPTPVLGLEYIAPSNSSIGGTAAAEQQGIGEVTVVATQPNTVIEVTPTVTGRAGKPAKVPFQVTLPAAGDVYQFQGVQNADISGTKIRSVSTANSSGCKPIAVFSATTWSAFDCTFASGGDNLYQQLFPTRTWGKKFITAPFINRPYDVYRIFVTDPATMVSVTNNGITSLLTAASYNINGGFYTVKTSNPLFIDADKPISVVQYIVSQNCKTGCTTNSSNLACQADPDMVVLNPIEQTLSDITFFSAHQNYVPPDQTQVTQHYVNVIIDKKYKSTVRIDNLPPTGVFVDVPGTNYSYLQENVTASSGTNPVHRIKADSSFSAIVYGYGQVESYGYNGGTNIKDLYQYVTLQNQYASVDFPATCVNTPFSFSITLPYRATSITWDFNNNANLSPNSQVANNAPVPDSTFIRDSRELYSYKLNTIYRFAQVGTYPVKVFANNPSPDGCEGIQEINYDVEVYDPPKADFSITNTGCQSDSVFFNDKTDGNGRPVFKWLWNFGNNTTDTIKNPVKLFNPASTYTIGLRAITDIGCLADTSKSLVLTTRPVAGFTTQGTYCPNNTISFVDASQVAIGNIVTWNWNFGNGTSITASTNDPVTSKYLAPGTYQVSLSVVSSTGCTSNVFTKSVIIYATPTVDFRLPGVCLPTGVAQFTNLSSSPDGNKMAFAWQFGDGATDTVANPVHVYASAGPYNVNLKATTLQGCTADSTITFSNIFAQPKAVFTASSVKSCASDSIRFTDNSTAAANTVTQWFWTFGDGTTSDLQNPTKKFATGGDNTVALCVKSAAGCLSDTMRMAIKIDSLPTAAFSTSAISCEGKEITFTDLSAANSGTITQWYWNFGDGTVNTSASGGALGKIYSNSGSYTVKLAVKTSNGCQGDTLSKLLTVHPQPVAHFQLPVVCLSDAYAEFKDSSYMKSGSSVLNYSWQFSDPLATPGNPNLSTAKDPRHKYGAVGNYPVTLAVATAAGCTDTITRLFTVNGAIPKTRFDVVNESALCSNTLVSIKNKSTIDFGDVTRMEITWDLQNAPLQTDTILFPRFDSVFVHQYAALQINKSYQLRVRIFSGGTCSDELTKTIVVNASPKVTIPTLAGICLDANARQVTMPANGNVAGSGTWSGLGISTGGVFSPAAADTGMHRLQYLYTSNAGCKDSALANIQVWPRPVANFGFSAITCVNNNIVFTDSSKPNFGKLAQWTWNFGDQPDLTTSNNNPIVHKYGSVQTYQVKLQVTTDSGCKSTVVQLPVNVHPNPLVAFTMPSICLPAGTGQFFDNSSIADGSQAQFSYRWKFQNSATLSNLKNPVQYFATTGPFAVQLTVTSPFGCVDSLEQLLNTVYAQPKAAFSFTPNDTCLGGTFYFTDNSGTNATIVNSWNWNFGDGATATIANPSHRYSAAKSYAVSLFIKDQHQCNSDTLVKNAVVHSYPIVDAGPDLFVLEGGNQALKATATGNGLQYLWLPAIYLDDNKLLNPLTTPLQDITYKLTVTATGGCKAEDQLSVTVLRGLGIPNAFSPNGDGINDKWIIKYLETYPGSTVEVFNRYGQQVFYSVGYNQPWDGMFKGSPLPVGTYYYIINPKNGRLPYKGSVTILK